MNSPNLPPSPPAVPSSSVEQLSLFSDDSPNPKPESSFNLPQNWFWLPLLLAIAGGAFVTWRLIPAGQTQPQASQTRSGAPPRPVETTTLAQGKAERRATLLGQVEAAQQFTIRAQTGGVIEQLLVQPGDRVNQGMTIAILNDSEQQLAVSEAKARLAQQRSQLARLEVGTRPEVLAQREAAVKTAKAREREAHDNLQRMEELVKQGAFSQRSLVEAQSALDVRRGERLEAEAELSEAKAGPIQQEIEAQRANVAAAIATLNQSQLSQQRTQIVAPATGVVQVRRVSKGDLIQSGSELVTLVGGDRLDIFLEIPENLSGRVVAGTHIEVTARALPTWKQRTSITAVVPAADTTSRRQRVRVELRNPPAGLLAGMAVEAILIQPSDRPSFVVSRDVLARRQNQWLIATLVDDKAKLIPVEMVADMGTQVAIFSPELRAGQTVVSRGVDGLQNGTTVKVVQPDAQPKDAQPKTN